MFALTLSEVGAIHESPAKLKAPSGRELAPKVTEGEKKETRLE